MLLPDFADICFRLIWRKKVCMDNLSELDQHMCVFNDNIEEGPMHTSGTHDYLVHT